MRVCEKCGHVDPPEWKHSKYSYWIDNCLLEDFEKVKPELAEEIKKKGHTRDKNYVYRLTKNRRRVERKALVD